MEFAKRLADATDVKEINLLSTRITHLNTVVLHCRWLCQWPLACGFSAFRFCPTYDSKALSRLAESRDSLTQLPESRA